MNLNDERIIREIIEKNFLWEDFNPKFDNIAQLRCNTFCVFHENHESPSAKFYWDEDKEIWVLYCFTEKKRFSAYDYLKLIVCEQWQKYKSPIDFLRQNMSEHEILRQYKLIEQQDIDLQEDMFEKKKEYIDNVFNESENIVDYIEELYTA